MEILSQLSTITTPAQDFFIQLQNQMSALQGGSSTFSTQNEKLQNLKADHRANCNKTHGHHYGVIDRVLPDFHPCAPSTSDAKDGKVDPDDQIMDAEGFESQAQNSTNGCICGDPES